MPSAPLRVLHLSSSFPRRAGDPVAPFLLELTTAQADRGTEVHVLAPHDKGLPTREALGQTEVHRFRYAPERLECLAYRGGMLATARRPRGLVAVPGLVVAFVVAALAVCHRERPDVIHAHWWFPAGVAGLVASRLLGIPLVVTVHGSDLALASRRGLRTAARAVLGRAATVTAVSEATAVSTDELLRAPIGTTTVTRMPVNAPTGAAAPFGSQPPLRLLAVGRLSPEKGLDVLVVAMSRLLAEGREAHLELVGAGPEEERLRRLAGPLGDRVSFRGIVPSAELDQVIDGCHVVVVPSRREGLGLVALEALARGRPVVASRVGGLPETVMDGEDGALVPPDDPRALADALMAVPVRPPVGRALARHRPEVVVGKLGAVYQAARTGVVGRWRPWRVFGAMVGVVTLVTLLVTTRHDWPAVRSAWSHPVPAALVVAVLASVAAEAGFGLASATALAALGQEVGAVRGAAGFLVAQTAKNLPGGIGLPVARAGVSARWGIPPRRAMAWLIVESVAGLAAGMALAGALLAAAGALGYETVFPSWAWVLIGLACLASPLALLPGSPLGRLAGRLVGDLPPPGALVRPVRVYAAVGLLSTLSIVALTRAIGTTGWGPLLLVAGSFIVASAVGFLALPVPAGIGVREAVFVGMTHPVLASSVALSIVIGARLLSLLVQTALALTALPLLGSRRAEPTDATREPGRHDLAAPESRRR